MNKGLKYGLGAVCAMGCVLALSISVVRSQAGTNGAVDSSKSVTSTSTELKAGKSAPSTDLAGRRYRRYWRRHTV